jgi:hypothetical protein
VTAKAYRPDKEDRWTHASGMYIGMFDLSSEAGYMFLQGVDENGRELTAGFTEQQFSTFALEIRMKSAGNNGQIRFNPNHAESLY